MDIRTAQTTGTLGAVRWLSTSRFLPVVSDATTLRSLPVASCSCSSVMPA